MEMQLIPRGALHAAGRTLPPHYLTKTVEDWWAIYFAVPNSGTNQLRLVADGVDLSSAYQAWIDAMQIPALVFEENTGDGWVRLHFEDLRVLGL